MNDEKSSQENELPRVVTIIAGVIFAPITLISVVGSAAIVFHPQGRNIYLTVVLGGIFLVGSISAFVWSLRLIFGLKKKSGGLFSPIMLRILSSVFLIIPVASVLAGTFMQAPVLHALQTVGYISIFFALNALAAKRKNEM